MKRTPQSLVTAAISVVMVSVSLACAKPGKKTDAEAPAPEGGDASISMLFAPGSGLEGSPNLFDATITRQDQTLKPIYRAGDLPVEGQTVSISNLPADPAATLTMNLYKGALQPANRTHACEAQGPIALVAGQAASVAVTCTSAIDPAANKIDVFLKVAKASLKISEQTADTVLAGKDFAADAVYAFSDAKGRRVSLRQDAGGLTFALGGDLVYLLDKSADQTEAPIVRLLAGESLTLKAVSGQLIQASPEDATLKLSNLKPLLFEQREGDGYGAALAVELANATGTVTMKGRLLEEQAAAEFVVASYNVENLFDQTDEERNQGYGDYRIQPNAQGQSSNFGTPVEFEGQTMSFTQVKIEGIRKALTGIDPMGPAVVGLVEVESRGAIEQLFERVKDLGYKQVLFSDTQDGAKPNAIGLGLLTKFPVLAWSLIQPVNPPLPQADVEPLRTILKATLDVHGQKLVVYVNHWKSKSGPESQRKACAEALNADITAMLADNPKADYIVMGDLNSDYNEQLVMTPEANDTQGQTGLNTVLKAQGDEIKVLKNTDPTLKYNLHYELERGSRRTAWHEGFGWSTLDHMIIGSGMYDQSGITYVDNSFQPAASYLPRLNFLFRADGTTHRWEQARSGLVTTHKVGGFSDHAPIFARFRVAARQSTGTIYLLNPSKPDAADK